MTALAALPLSPGAVLHNAALMIYGLPYVPRSLYCMIYTFAGPARRLRIHSWLRSDSILTLVFNAFTLCSADILG